MIYVNGKYRGNDNDEIGKLIDLLSGYLDDWENISFEDKRKATDGLILSAAFVIFCKGSCIFSVHVADTFFCVCLILSSLWYDDPRNMTMHTIIVTPYCLGTVS